MISLQTQQSPTTHINIQLTCAKKMTARMPRMRAVSPENLGNATVSPSRKCIRGTFAARPIITSFNRELANTTSRAVYILTLFAAICYIVGSYLFNYDNTNYL